MSTVTFDGTKCDTATKAAILVKIDGKDVWVPKSLVHEDSECYKPGTSGTLVVPEWWAVKAGLV